MTDHRRLASSETGVTAAMFFLAAATAVTVATVTGGASPPLEYSTIARNIVEGRGAFLEYLGTRYYFYGPIVYPMLLAVPLWLGDHTGTTVVVLHGLLFGATCVGIYWIARGVLAKGDARFAAVLAATHPGGLIYTGKLHPQTFDTFLIVLSFLLLTRMTTVVPPLRAGGAGLVTGLTVLSRGTTAPFFALWTAWFLWKERKTLTRAARVVTVLAIGGAVVVSPVIVRGYLLYGKIVPLRTDLGVNLWYGNHRGASGTSYVSLPSPTPVISRLEVTLSARLERRNEFDQNRVFLNAVREFGQQEPMTVIRLFLKKLYYFWWFSPHAGLLYPARWTLLYQVYYSVASSLAVLGILACLRSAGSSTRATAALFLVLAGTVSVTQAAFYVEGRHRWQVEPLLLMFTAAGALSLWRWLRASRSSYGRDGVPAAC